MFSACFWCQAHGGVHFKFDDLFFMNYVFLGGTISQDSFFGSDFSGRKLLSSEFDKVSDFLEKVFQRSFNENLFRIPEKTAGGFTSL